MCKLSKLEEGEWGGGNLDEIQKKSNFFFVKPSRSLILRAEFGTALKLIKKIQIENQTLQRFWMHVDETAVFYKIVFYDLAILKVQYLFWINLVKEKVKQIEHLSWQISLQNLCTRCKCNGETDIKQVLANLKMQNVPKRNAYIFF